MKKVAVVQSNYIPWKGYFDLIAAVDEFIILDDVQYTRRDWRNRNVIKTPEGPKWLTIPVKSKGHYHQTIREVEIDGTSWGVVHQKALQLNYRRAAHFDEIAALLDPFLRNPHPHLTELNCSIISAICGYLGIGTTISHSSGYRLTGEKSERLANLCFQAGATEYVSGPSAKTYLREQDFKERGIQVTWFDYDGYPEYPQLWGAFIHHVTILDLLFNCGKQAPLFMKHVHR
ncbi:MAG: WbqC family protein [Xanthobacteraceae bacterium]|nr:WbqC family protein [Xanthobacteraceae bacterium]